MLGTLYWNFIDNPEGVWDEKMILAVIHEQAAGVGYRLRLQKLYTRTASIKLRFAEFKTITRELTLTEATNRDTDIYHTAKELFRRHCGNSPWQLIGGCIQKRKVFYMIQKRSSYENVNI